ncbi:MAG: metallopeptidase family protein [Pirellulales bacterium]
MEPGTREDFDRNLEIVLERLPATIRRLLDDVPLHVEDYPSRDVLERTGVARPEWLCGLYTGIPLIERSVEQSRPAPDVVTLYREGILHLTADTDGYVTENALQRQIRITLLHELGHHHGLSEEDLDEMGYG